ncbi:MAG: tetratricopeptide repeat protein [Promethearchaeota archaeon]
MALETFNPTLSSYDYLKKTFVQREEMLRKLLKKIGETKKKGTVHQFLLVGPRGIGKTHFMLLAYYEIKKKKTLSDKWISIKFSEEEYSIDSLATFFIKTLEELMHEVESKKIISKAEQLLANIDEMSDEDVIEKSKKYLSELSEKHDKRLVIFVDNINLIFEQIGDSKLLEHLRSILMTENYLVLVGGAISYFKKIKNYEEPFYNFFEIIRFDELKKENVELFIKKLAEVEKKEDIIKNFETFKPRIRSIVHFTGGNPRLIRMLFYVISDFKLIEVKESLEKLLDELTPYYQGIMDNLPPQQRKILDIMAIMDGPATPTEIAKKARMDRGVVNTQMKRMEENGLIQLAKQEKRKRRLYEITERFFRIWREMRTAKRNQRLGFLTKFLRHFYTESEFKRYLEHIEKEFPKVSGKKKIKEAQKLFEQLEILKEAAPERLSMEISCNLIDKYLQFGDVDHAESELLCVKEKVRENGIGIEEYLRKTAKVYGTKAMKYFESGEFEKALDYFNKILESDSKNKGGLLGKAFTLYELEKYVETIEASNKVLEIDPRSESALHWKANSLFGLHKYEEAIGWYDRLLEINPKNECAMLGIATSLLELKKYEEAIESYNKVLEINSKNVAAIRGKAASLLLLQKYTEAIGWFDRDLEIHAKDEGTHYWKARSLFNLQKFEEALEWFDKALKINPRYKDALFWKARSLANLGKDEEAITWFDKVLEINPKNENALHWKASSLSTLGKEEEAIEWLDKVLEINPKNKDALTMKAFFLSSHGKYEEGIELFNKVLEMNSKDEGAILGKAVSLMGLKNFVEAIEWFDNALKINPKNDLASLCKADSLSNLGKYKEAIKWFDKVLKINSKNDEAWKNKGILLFMIKDIKKVITWFNEVTKIWHDINDKWLFEDYSLDKNIRQENMFHTLDKIAKSKQKIPKKAKFKEFINKVTKYTVSEVLKYSLKDLQDQNFGEAKKKLNLLFDNNKLWKDLEVESTIIDYLIEVLKIDLKNGEKILKMFEENLGEEFTETFKPIKITINYLTTKDKEILDKLHPEVREIVEEIVMRIQGD